MNVKRFSRKLTAFAALATLLSTMLPSTLLAASIDVPDTEVVYSSNYSFQATLDSWQNGDDFEYRLQGDTDWLAMQQIQNTSTFFGDVTLEPGSNTIELVHIRPAGQNTEVLAEAEIMVNFEDLELLSSTDSSSESYILEVNAPGFDNDNSTLAYSVDGGATYTTMTASATEDHFTANLTLEAGVNEVMLKETSVFEQDPLREKTVFINFFTLNFISSNSASDPDYLLTISSNAFGLEAYDVEYRAYQSDAFAVPATWTVIEPSFIPNLHTQSIDLSDITNGSAKSVNIDARIVFDVGPLGTIVKKEATLTVDYNPFLISLLSDENVFGEPDHSAVNYELEVDVAGVIKVPVPNATIEYATSEAGANFDANAATWTEMTVSDSQDSFVASFDVTHNTDIHVRVVSVFDDILSEKTFELTYITNEDVDPFVYPHENIDEACVFVDVDYETLYENNRDYYDAVVNLCDIEGWVAGDDTEVTIDGKTGRQVRLDDRIARTEFAKLVVVGPGNVDLATINNELATGFNDTPSGQWFSGPVRVARENSWMNGYKDSQGNVIGFGPVNELSFAEATVVMLRVADVDFSNSCDGDQAARLNVAGEGREWMADAMCFADDNNLLHLEGVDFFDPADAKIQRKEVFHLMERLLQEGLIG